MDISILHCILGETLEVCIHEILFRRGIYPPSSFTPFFHAISSNSYYTSSTPVALSSQSKSPSSTNNANNNTSKQPTPMKITPQKNSNRIKCHMSRLAQVIEYISGFLQVCIPGICHGDIDRVALIIYGSNPTEETQKKKKKNNVIDDDDDVDEVDEDRIFERFSFEFDAPAIRETFVYRFANKEDHIIATKQVNELENGLKQLILRVINVDRISPNDSTDDDGTYTSPYPITATFKLSFRIYQHDKNRPCPEIKKAFDDGNFSESSYSHDNKNNTSKESPKEIISDTTPNFDSLLNLTQSQMSSQESEDFQLPPKKKRRKRNNNEVEQQSRKPFHFLVRPLKSIRMPETGLNIEFLMEVPSSNQLDK